MHRFTVQKFLVLGCLTFALSLAHSISPALALQDTSAAPTEFKTDSGKLVVQVVKGLNNPSAVSIQPETGIVYVADSGNGQVVRIVDGKVEPTIVEFPKEGLATTPSVNIGPLSLLFLGRDNLLVGTGGQPAGEDSLRLYSVSDFAVGKPEPLKFSASKSSLNLPADAGQSLPGEGNFIGLAAVPNALFATSQSESGKGWIDIATKTGIETLLGFSRYIATSETVNVSTPTAITVTPHGYLLVSCVGSLGTERDSVAAFYEPASKKMLMKLELGLLDVVSILYSPRRQMYALDMAWSQPESGGLYRVIEDKSAASGLRTKRIAALPNATSMCFDSDGGVYVTLRGPVDAQGNSQGTLVYIPADESL